VMMMMRSKASELQKVVLLSDYLALNTTIIESGFVSLIICLFSIVFF